jgi:hypothetical protein
MSGETYLVSQRTLRGMDSNSLLRIYDSARDFMTRCASQTERTRMGKAIHRITDELRRRKVPGVKLESEHYLQ